MKSAGMLLVLLLMGCSTGRDKFTAGALSICVPKERQISTPFWVGDSDRSVAFSGCSDDVGPCGLPKEVDSGVLIPPGKFQGWRKIDFDKEAFYARKTDAALRSGRYSYLDGHNIIKIPSAPAGGKSLYWQASSAGEVVDSLLLICDSSRSDGERESAARCVRMIGVRGFSIEYEANFDHISMPALKKIDMDLLRGLESWRCGSIKGGVDN